MCRALCALLWYCSAFPSLLDTIRSYKAFRYDYSFSSLPLAQKGNFKGFVNLLSKREERRGEIRDIKGKVIKRSFLRAGGNWEFLPAKKGKGWEKRIRSEQSDILKIIELILLNESVASPPKYGDTSFLPNLQFLDPLGIQRGKGQIRYQRGKITEIAASDSLRGVSLRIRLSNHNQIRNIPLPFSPKFEVKLLLPERGVETTLSVLRRRIELLGVNYELAKKRRRAILRFEEDLEDKLLNLLFSTGNFNLWAAEVFADTPHTASIRCLNSPFPYRLIRNLGQLRDFRITPLPNALLLTTENLLDSTADLILEIEPQLFFLLTVDKVEKEGKIKTLRLECIGKERELLMAIFKEAMPFPLRREQ